MEKIIYDAKGAVVGRLSTAVVKDLLKGNEVFIINSEEAILSGNTQPIVEKLKRLMNMGRSSSLKGPKIIRSSDRILKRMIRGMLPWDKPRGRAAFKRLKCFIGNGEFSEDDLKNVKKVGIKKPIKYVEMRKVVGALK